MPDRRKPRFAVWKFASCDGCQLSLLDCEDELLAVGGRDRHRLFCRSVAQDVRGPYDLSLVEGSITTPHDAERIQRVRGVETAGHHRRLRHCWRYPGIAKFRGCTGVRSLRLCRTPSTCGPSRPRRRSAPMSPSISNCAAVRSTKASCSKSSRPFWSGANRRSPVTASASSASRAAIRA